MTDFEREFLDLLNEVMDMIGRTEDEVLTAGRFQDLSRSEMHTLKAIGPYEVKTMGETAKLLKITTGSLSVQMDRLVKKGYVLRRKKTEDRRVVELKLSKKGKLVCRLHDRFSHLLLDYLLEPFDLEEQEVLFRAMMRVDTYLNMQYGKYKSRAEHKNLDEAKEENPEDD